MGTTYPFMTPRIFTGAGFGPMDSDRLATPCRPGTRWDYAIIRVWRL